MEEGSRKGEKKNGGGSLPESPKGRRRGRRSELGLGSWRRERRMRKERRKKKLIYNLHNRVTRLRRASASPCSGRHESSRENFSFRRFRPRCSAPEADEPPFRKFYCTSGASARSGAPLKRTTRIFPGRRKERKERREFPFS